MERYNVKLGPVVGKIDSGYVRILLEFDNTANCNLFLKVLSRSVIVEKMVNCFVGSNIFVIKLLNNEHKHTIEFKHAISNNTIAVCTFTPIVTATAIISCDGLDKENKQRSWNNANHSGVSNAIHIGDQVYIDNAYSVGMSKITPEMTDKQAELIFSSEIRQIYYDSWYKC